jgi:hypothetical protein
MPILHLFTIKSFVEPNLLNIYKDFILYRAIKSEVERGNDKKTNFNKEKTILPSIFPINFYFSA